jgi:hypothetical protein
MPNTEEQRLDLIENCNLLLNGILVPFEQTDNTPEGRMITQLKWLKERAENHDLPLPVDPDKLATIRYVYTDGELCRHASSPEKAWEEIEVPQKKIITLAKKGDLLYRPEYETYALRCIDTLIHTLKNADRLLDQYEEGLINELGQIKNELKEKKIMPPLGSPKPAYPNYLKVDTYHPSIGDLANGKATLKQVSNLIFNGIRPDTWLTPELADKETQL